MKKAEKTYVEQLNKDRQMYEEYLIQVIQHPEVHSGEELEYVEKLAYVLKTLKEYEGFIR